MSPKKRGGLLSLCEQAHMVSTGAADDSCCSAEDKERLLEELSERLEAWEEPTSEYDWRVRDLVRCTVVELQASMHSKGEACQKPCPFPGCNECQRFWDAMVQLGYWRPGYGLTDVVILSRVATMPGKAKEENT